MLLIGVTVLISQVLADSLTGKTFTIYTDKRTWNEARTICENAGGRLARIENKATQEALLAYSTHSDDVWVSQMTNSFWIGGNKEGSSSAPFRWDHCEAISSGSGFTFWSDGDPQNPSSSHCVMAEKDSLRWRTEACDSDGNQYLCEEDTGSCTYTYTNVGGCSGANSQNTIDGLTHAECEGRCNTDLNSNDLACWMFKHTGSSCTLFFDADPEKCSSPSGGTTTAGIRSCFTYQVNAYTSSISKTDTTPVIDCDLYTTAASTTTTPSTSTSTTTTTSTPTSTPTTTTSTPTTATTTTLTTTPTTTTTTTTSTLTTATTIPATTSATTIPSSTPTTTTPTTAPTSTVAVTIPTTSPTNTTTTTPLTTTQTSIPVTTTLTTSSTLASATSSSSTIITQTSNTASATGASTSATTDNSSSTGTNTATSQTTQNDTTTQTSASTATTPSTNTATSTVTTPTASTPSTASVTSSMPPSSTTSVKNISGSQPLVSSCSCSNPQCITLKNSTEIQELVDLLIEWIKVDPATLSSTRRKKESAKDDRPTAQAIGNGTGIPTET